MVVKNADAVNPSGTVPINTILVVTPHQITGYRLVRIDAEESHYIGYRDQYGPRRNQKLNDQPLSPA